MITTEPTTETETLTADPIAPVLTETKTSAFLGLYVPVPLKNKVSEAAKSQRRSMSSFAVGVFEDYFNRIQPAQ
jgi:hypothetical protein